MNPFLLLAGIAVGAGVFAATLWSATQIFRESGTLQRVHITAFALVLVAMATLQFLLKIPSQLAGGLLIPVAGMAFWLEPGWNKVLPIFHIFFGAALVAALPFGG